MQSGSSASRARPMASEVTKASSSKRILTAFMPGMSQAPNQRAVERRISIKPRSHLIEVAEDRTGDVYPAERLNLLLTRGLAQFVAYFFQFACVEPVSAAARALIDLDPPFGAEVAPFQFHTLAFRTGALVSGIHVKIRIALDVDQPGAGRFLRLVHLLKLECVEPNAAAAPAA